jgi:hypothetical protein
MNLFLEGTKLFPRGHLAHVEGCGLVLAIPVHMLHASCLTYACLNIAAATRQLQNIVSNYF